MVYDLANNIFVSFINQIKLCIKDTGSRATNRVNLSTKKVGLQGDESQAVNQRGEPSIFIPAV
jgi:hypothetical protein